MLNKLLSTANKPHALLVLETHHSNFNNFLKLYLKNIVCTKKACNECVWCKKIDANAYYDLYILDAKTSVIKKEEVIDLMQKLSQNGVEQINTKFYVIKNIEFASKFVLNTLLKFVEESPKNTYAIFSTKNFQCVLPTIKSRCLSLILSPETNAIDMYLDSCLLQAKQKEIIKNCYSSLEDIKLNINSFQKKYQFAIDLISDKNSLLINSSLADFKKFTYEEISLLLSIFKYLLLNESMKLVKLQDTLYLNPNKLLLFNQILNLIQEEKCFKQQ